MHNVKYLWKYNCHYGDEKKFTERRNDGHFRVNCASWHTRTWVWVKSMVVIDRIRYPSCYITFLWVTITCIARINNWNSFPFLSRILLLVTVSALHGPKSDDWWFWNLIVTLLWSVDNATWIDVLRTLTFDIVPLNLDFSKLGRPDNGEQVKSSLRTNLSCSVSHLKTKNKQENHRLFTFFSITWYLIER